MAPLGMDCKIVDTYVAACNVPALRFLPPFGYDPTTRMTLVEDATKWYLLCEHTTRMEANLAALHEATAATTP